MELSFLNANHLKTKVMKKIKEFFLISFIDFIKKKKKSNDLFFFFGCLSF